MLLSSSVEATMIKSNTGNWVDVTYDGEREMARFEAEVKSNQYFAIGYGMDMDDTDMVVF